MSKKLIKKFLNPAGTLTLGPSFNMQLIANSLVKDGIYPKELILEKLPNWLIPKKFNDAEFVEKLMRRSNGGNWRNLFGIADINTGSRKVGEHTTGPLGLIERPTPDRNRDLVSLYMRETSLLVPYKNPTPIFVNGQELTGDLYEGKIFMGDSMILPMHMLQIVEDYVNNGKIMSMETNTPEEDSWYEYNNKGKTYDNTRAHYISLKKGDDGKYYADIFDRWDMDHNLLGRTLESKHGKPFIIRLKVPIHFSEEYDYDTMSYLLNLHEIFLHPSNSWRFKKELNRNFNVKKLSKKEQDKADLYGYMLRETIN